MPYTGSITAGIAGGRPPATELLSPDTMREGCESGFSSGLRILEPPAQPSLEEWKAWRGDAVARRRGGHNGVDSYEQP
eukprot:scaffold1435_cov267-Pinguiococcus_pyrenoidosus.AAC.11